MPKTRKVKKKSIFRPVHLQALLFLIAYNVISGLVFLKSVASSNVAINFGIPFVFGVISGCIFLYLLRHEEFFHFMKEVEDIEKKTEKKYINKFISKGKVLASMLVIIVGGPVLGAAAIRLLLPRYDKWFWVLFVGNLVATIFSVGVAKGLFKIF